MKGQYAFTLKITELKNELPGQSEIWPLETAQAQNWMAQGMGFMKGTSCTNRDFNTPSVNFSECEMWISAGK